MSARGRPAGKCQVKMTVSEAATPDLFVVLASIADLRARAARLRDLAAKGLMAERGSGPARLQAALIPAAGPPVGRPAASAAFDPGRALDDTLGSWEG